MAPRCSGGCGALWGTEQVFSISEQGGDIVECNDCKKIWTIRKPPEWFNKVIPYVKYLVGEESPEATEGKIDAEGMSMECTSCKANIVIEDTSNRNIKCRYCSNEMIIPDEAWSRIHPVTTAHFWYILLDFGDNVALLPDDIDDFIDLEAMPNGDTILLWEQDSVAQIARADRTGGLRWVTKKLNISDYARFLFDAQNQLIWVLEKEEDMVYAFNVDTGEKVVKIENEDEDPKLITAKDHDGIAVNTDGTIIVFRYWNDGDDGVSTLRRFALEKSSSTKLLNL